MLIEYRVRPVTRYVVTRFETSGPDAEGKGFSQSTQRGEFDTEHVAYEVAYALCGQEHERLSWGVDDERIRYPENPDSKDAVKA